jgi:gluconate 5-dehydrogenase
VNNVGMRDSRSLLDFDLASVRQLMETNLIAPFELARRQISCARMVMAASSTSLQ